MCKIDVRNPVTYLINRTSIFEWYVVGCNSKSRCQKIAYLIKIKKKYDKSF